MTDLRQQLQDSLGTAYTIERELGGGGMSRVFVATENRLGRRVVIKVLSPELSAAISAARFEREIKVAASLQQANIVPVLAAGECDGMPYYTMPFVEGESLRARLARGATTENEALNILRDVARALLYAHDHGIVHRDIKPDNVLLSGEAAVVTDFGIAKAISAARTHGDGDSSEFTQLGTSIGTPAYMAPEQAAGDPNIDHRADIYAFGCLAFELLTGTPPFHDMAPHRLMAAHIGQEAPSVRSRRESVGTELDALVAACLAKQVSDRPESAREILQRLENASVSSPRDALPRSLTGRQWTLTQAVLIWGASFVATWVLARAAVVGIGLPSWTVPLATSVAALGLPAVLVTWFLQKTARRALLQTPTVTPGGTEVRSTIGTLAIRAVPYVSWNRTWKGGALAGASVIAAVAVVMILRQFGLGPAASLLAAGRIDADSRLLVADFTSNATDTTLGAVTAQAVRTSLGQSGAIELVSPGDVANGLRRMTLPVTTRLTDSVARELAMRGSIPLVITGQVATIGTGFLVSARLATGDSAGSTLAEFQEGADGPADLLKAIDKLTGDIRARIGESLRSVQRATPLNQATTSSLVALREYTIGDRLGNYEGDFLGGLAHLEAAVREDSTFAMAWRRIAVTANNTGLPLSRQVEASSAAYRFRDRLPPDERGAVELYHLAVVNTAAALAKHREEARLGWWTNFALELRNVGNYAAAESVLSAGLARVNAVRAAPIIQFYVNQVFAQLALGKVDSARKTLNDMEALYPNANFTDVARSTVSWVAGGLDSLEALLRSRENSSMSRLSRAGKAGTLAIIAGTRGQLRRFGTLAVTARMVADSAGTSRGRVAETDEIVTESVHRREESKGVARIDSLRRVRPESNVPLLDQSGLETAIAYAQLGRADKALPLIEDFERRATPVERQVRWPELQAAKGEAALASNKAADALAAFRLSTDADSGAMVDPIDGRLYIRLALAFDRLGMRDSAIAQFEKYARRSVLTFLTAPLYLPLSYRRLGELYEQNGDVANAIKNYSEFVKLWANADPELQPQVAEIRTRLQTLLAAEARKR